MICRCILSCCGIIVSYLFLLLYRSYRHCRHMTAILYDESDGDKIYSRSINQRDVSRGGKSYSNMSKEGKARIYRQKMTGMNKETLQNVLSRAKCQWVTEQGEFPNFCQQVDSILSGTEYDMIENIERSSSGREFLFYHVKHTGFAESSKYDMVLCYLTADVSVTQNEFIGGMVNEGYIGINEEDQLYLL